MAFQTVLSQPCRFLVYYSIGSKKKFWECIDFSASLVRARFHKQPFAKSLHSPARVLDVFKVVSSMEF